MTSGWGGGWLGGSGVVPGQAESFTVWGRFAGQAAVNAWGARCGALQGARSPRIRRPGEVAIRADASSPTTQLFAMRHGMLPLRGAISPKTSRPARREPHYICGLPAARIKPRRPRFTASKEAGFFDINPRRKRRRGPWLVLGTSLPAARGLGSGMAPCPRHYSDHQRPVAH